MFLYLSCKLHYEQTSVFAGQLRKSAPVLSRSVAKCLQDKVPPGNPKSVMCRALDKREYLMIIRNNFC